MPRPSSLLKVATCAILLAPAAAACGSGAKHDGPSATPSNTSSAPTGNAALGGSELYQAIGKALDGAAFRAHGSMFFGDESTPWTVDVTYDAAKGAHIIGHGQGRSVDLYVLPGAAYLKYDGQGADGGDLDKRRRDLGGILTSQQLAKVDAAHWLRLSDSLWLQLRDSGDLSPARIPDTSEFSTVVMGSDGAFTTAVDKSSKAVMLSVPRGSAYSGERWTVPAQGAALPSRIDFLGAGGAPAASLTFEAYGGVPPIAPPTNDVIDSATL